MDGTPTCSAGGWLDYHRRWDSWPKKLPQTYKHLSEGGWRSAAHAMVTKGATTVADGAAIPIDVKAAGCNSSRTRLKRAMWKKRALVKAPTELRLGGCPNPGNIQHAWCFKNQITPFTLHNDLAMSLTKKKKKKKKWWNQLHQAAQAAIRKIQITEILHVETKTPPTSTGCLRFTFVSNPLPLKKTIPQYYRHTRVATRSNTT